MTVRRLSRLAVLSAVLWLATAAGGRAQEAPVPAGGNALAGMPLDTLTATRERPLFRPSRRPPAIAPVAAPVVAAPVAAPAESGPHLTLVGVIRSTERGIAAVVLDDTTHRTLTIRPGDAPQGWVVQSVDARTAVLVRDGRTSTLTMSAAPAGPAGPDDGIAE